MLDSASALRWYAEQGLDETIGEDAIDRFSVAPPAPAAAPVPMTPRAAPPQSFRPSAPPPVARAPVPLESPQLVEDARELARKCNTLAELEQAVRGFEGCALKRTAKNTVFADGVAGAPVMVVGEQAMCLAFTRRHIELAKPKLLVLAGGVAVKAVLDTAEGIMRLRGKWTSVKLDDGTEVPAMPTFHPAYLLRTPASKRQSWSDLLMVDKRLKELGTR